MKQNLLEVIMGAVVLIVCAVFIVVAYSSSHWNSVKGYEVIAKFDRIDGLKQGSDVRLGGVKVGIVKTIRLEPGTYLAVVEISLPPEVTLPKDTAAEIASESLLGGKFLALVPGGEEEMLSHGGEICHTQSSMNLESLIGRFVFNAQEKK